LIKHLGGTYVISERQLQFPTRKVSLFRHRTHIQHSITPTTSYCYRRHPSTNKFYSLNYW